MSEVRIIKQSYNRIFVEAPPYEQLVSIGAYRKKHVLPLPWTYYIFRIEHIYNSVQCVWLAGSHRQKQHWRLFNGFVLPLPNVYGAIGRRGKLCTPWQNGHYNFDDPAVGAKLIADFWNCNFGYLELAGHCHSVLTRKAKASHIRYREDRLQQMYEYWSNIKPDDLKKQRWLRSPIICHPKLHFHNW